MTPGSLLDLRTQTRNGAFALGIRQVAVVGTHACGAIALARILSPSNFALYAVALLMVGILRALCDAGFAAALVRQRDAPSELQLSSVFWAQMLIAAAVAALFAISAALAGHYRSWPGVGAMLGLGAVACLFVPLQATQIALLERDLRFAAIGLTNSIEALTFNAIAVSGAVFARAPVALGCAIITQFFAGAVVYQISVGWRPRIAFSRSAVRGLVGYSLKYQTAVLLNLAKDTINPVLVGALVGAAAVGYIQWAAQTAAFATIAVMILQRLYLPVFARIARDPAALKNGIDKVLLAANAIVAPLAIGIAVLIIPIIHVVYGTKWLPAENLFYLFWLSNLTTPTVTPLLAAFNAIGRSGVSLLATVAWSGLTWALGFPLILLDGAQGFAVAAALVQLVNLYFIHYGARSFDFDYRAALGPWVPAMAAWVPALLVSILYPDWARSDAGLCILCTTGATLYMPSLRIFSRQQYRTLLSLAGWKQQGLLLWA